MESVYECIKNIVISYKHFLKKFLVLLDFKFQNDLGLTKLLSEQSLKSLDFLEERNNSDENVDFKMRERIHTENLHQETDTKKERNYQRLKLNHMIERKDLTLSKAQYSGANNIVTKVIKNLSFSVNKFDSPEENNLSYQDSIKRITNIIKNRTVKKNMNIPYQRKKTQTDSVFTIEKAIGTNYEVNNEFRVYHEKVRMIRKLINFELLLIFKQRTIQEMKTFLKENLPKNKIQVDKEVNTVEFISEYSNLKKRKSKKLTNRMSISKANHKESSIDIQTKLEKEVIDLNNWKTEKKAYISKLETNVEILNNEVDNLKKRLSLKVEDTSILPAIMEQSNVNLSTIKSRRQKSTINLKEFLKNPNVSLKSDRRSNSTLANIKVKPKSRILRCLSDESRELKTKTHNFTPNPSNDFSSNLLFDEKEFERPSFKSSSFNNSFTSRNLNQNQTFKDSEQTQILTNLNSDIIKRDSLKTNIKDPKVNILIHHKDQTEKNLSYSKKIRFLDNFPKSISNRSLESTKIQSLLTKREDTNSEILGDIRMKSDSNEESSFKMKDKQGFLFDKKTDKQEILFDKMKILKNNIEEGSINTNFFEEIGLENTEIIEILKDKKAFSKWHKGFVTEHQKCGSNCKHLLRFYTMLLKQKSKGNKKSLRLSVRFLNNIHLRKPL